MIDRNIKAVLFDLDGTLIESEPLHYAAWNDLLSEFGFALEPNDYLGNLSGVSVPDNARRLIERHGLAVDVNEFVQKREQLYKEKLLKQGVSLMPFALETLDFFKSSGIRIGLVTSSARHEVDTVLTKTGLAHYFDVTITRDDVTRVKPDGDPYLTGAKAMGFDKDAYLVFEDTLTGVTSARNAGLYCFAIPSIGKDMERLREIADEGFPNLSDATQFLIKNNLLNISA